MTEEIWRTTSRDPMYEVSSYGRVRSVDREIIRSNGVKLPLKSRILRPWSGSSGYLQVYLSNRRAVMIHHLVLETFVSPRPEGLEGRHLNGKMHDNRVSNLEWATHSINVLDRITHGTDHQKNKTHCPHNHPLEEPNLVESRWREGYRLCKACQREYFRARWQGRDFDTNEADQDYEYILSGKKRVRGGIR